MPANDAAPAFPLARFLEEIAADQPAPPRRGRLVLLTGPSGAGKSRLCLELAREAGERGWSVAGYVAPAVFAGGARVGMDLLDLRSGSRHRLATARTDAAPGGLRTLRWRLDSQVLRLANERLAGLDYCDLLIVDELGPLEWRRGEGLVAALRLIDSRRLPLVAAVVRPAHLAEACARWPWAEQVTLGEAGDA